MTTVENKISRLVLNRIRTRSRENSSLLQTSGVFEAPILREVSFSDFEFVADLKRRWSMAVDSPQNWERLWRQNPSTGRANRLPIGWVLQSGERIVGFLGNIPLIYCYGLQTVQAAAATSLVVEPSYRMFTLKLMGAFFGQSGVDLLLATTAIESVGKMACAFGADCLPQSNYKTVLFWILRSYPFARAVTKRIGINEPMFHVASTLSSVAVGLDGVFRGRRPRCLQDDLNVKQIDVNEIGEDFEKFWLEKQAESTRLYADRSAATLRWHFKIPGFRGTTRVLGCYQGTNLLGYVVVRNNPPQKGGMRQSLLADIMAKSDDQRVLRRLFVAAYDCAKQAGGDVLEVAGLPPEIRQLCLKWKPYARSFPACPFYFKANDPTLHGALKNSTAWYPTPFDGDSTLMP